MTFSWPHLPTTEAEFEELMQAIDSELNSRGFRPAQRPLPVARLLWEAFGWGGNALPPKDLALQLGFEGQILLAKAYRWYDIVYADQLKLDFSLGYGPHYRGICESWEMEAQPIGSQMSAGVATPEKSNS
jgi:hypothetical protein